MANATGPFGLTPVRYMDGTPWDGATIDCYISSSYATALFVGDPVLMSPTLAEKDTTTRLPTVNTHAGTDGLIVWGVIRSFEADPTNLERKHNPASTERRCKVVRCADDLVFQIRDDGSGAPSKVWAGQNAEMQAGSGGSTVTGLSSFALEGLTPAANQSYPLWIIGLAAIEDNELDDYAIWDVLINTNNNTTGRILGVTAV
jgi:hypothetical protein